MSQFFYWSGIVAWAAFGSIGMLVAGAVAVDFIVDTAVHMFWTKREFLAFVADRLKSKTDKDEAR